MPSVLAIRDLQRRLRGVLRELPLGDSELVKVLQLDPLAVLRGLRVAYAPVFGANAGFPTIRGLVDTLGPAMSRRLLDTAPVAVAGTAQIRRLWLHAVATATAARDLASAGGPLEPEAAYLLGLLHDLPAWLDQLHANTSGDATATRWLEHWQMPQELLALGTAFGGPLPASAAGPFHTPADLVRAAELLANLADFGHKDGDENLETGRLLNAADKADLVAAQRLRRKVEGALRTFGLDPNVPELELDGSTANLPFAAERRGGLEDVVRSILGCARAESYRGIVTAITAAAVRYGGYDHALYAKWIQSEQTLTLRTKADSSARRLRITRLVATTDEAEELRCALREERAAHLAAPFGRRLGVLAALGADEILAVPLNRAFGTPSFLLLDRTLSLLPTGQSEDITLATTLGMTGSLLTENLLLRRRRQRAQKFALTDSLTHLFNRRMGLLALQQEMARADRSGRPLTVLMCDLDHFKQLNDTLGHLQGDNALRATADVLRQTLRKTDLICRYGGEEFLVVLPETHPDDATVLATRLFTAIQERGEAAGLPITISIGLTALRVGDTVESMLLRADRALYASKGFGRNRFSADLDSSDDTKPAPAST